MSKFPTIPETVLGIDCFHEDVIPSFRYMKDAGVKVCIAKLGEGTFVDRSFISHIQRASMLGMANAGYWFARPDVNTAIQGGSIIGNLPKGMRVFLDLEPSLEKPNDLGSDRWEMLSLARRQKVLAGLVSTAKAMIPPKSIGLYCTKDFWENVLGAPDGYQAHPWWAAEYGVDSPKQAKNLGPWVGWQFTGTGAIPGFTGDADLSLWKKTFWGLV